jgi:lysophospholipase L1-like esterase
MKALSSLQVLLGLAVLGGSVALNVVLARAAFRYYGLLNDTRLDPFGLQKGSAPPSDRDTRPRVVVIGDSRAGAWKPPLSPESTQFINRGMSGHTTAQALGRFQQHVADLEPDLVLIQAGINDLKAIPLFPDRKTEIIEQCKANIQELVSRSEKTGAKIVVTTIIPAGSRIPLVRIPFWPREVDEAVEACSTGIRTLASDRVVVFDTAPIIVSEPNGRVKPQYQRDFLHLNAEGYAVLNRQLTPLLTTLLQ